MRLVYKTPPPDVLLAHQSGLANFDTGSQIGTLLLQSSKACRVSVLVQDKVDHSADDFAHCVKSAGWRFLAGDSSQAGATHVGSVGSASPKLTGFSGEPEVADAIGLLPELVSIPEVQTIPELQTGTFELRFLRVPWLRFEAFWLHAKDADDADSQRDYVVPYTDFAAAPKVGLEVMKAYPVAKFLEQIRPKAEPPAPTEDSPQPRESHAAST